MNLSERARGLHQQGVHSVLATFTDLHGTPRGKLVPLSGLADAVTVGAGFAGPSIWGTGLPDAACRVDAALAADASLCEAVGHRFCEQFLQIQRAEWDAYARQVSDWELERYASAG